MGRLNFGFKRGNSTSDYTNLFNPTRLHEMLEQPAKNFVVPGSHDSLIVGSSCGRLSGMISQQHGRLLGLFVDGWIMDTLSFFLSVVSLV